MIRHFPALVASIFAFAASAMADVTLGGGVLRVTLDETGKVTAMSLTGGSNLVDASRPGFLLMVQPSGSEDI